jgi:hypothetical protein
MVFLRRIFGPPNQHIVRKSHGPKGAPFMQLIHLEEILETVNLFKNKLIITVIPARLSDLFRDLVPLL